MTDILLRDVNSARADALLLHLGAQGMAVVPKSGDIIAHMVLDGTVCIEPAGDGPLTILEAGEFALLFYGNRHTLYAAPRRPAGEGTAITNWPSGDEPLEMHIGPGREKARVLSAALRLIHNPTLAHGHNPLDDVVRLARNESQIFKYGLLMMDPAQIEAAAKSPGANAFVNALMNLHLTHVIRCGGMQLGYAFRNLMQTPYLMSSEKSRAVATALRLLQTSIEKNWSVASLAHEVGQSRSTFAATFSSCVGTGPIEYLNTLRMDKAAALLSERRLDLPMVTIANRVGYETPSSFARAFKTHFGVSPRAFGRQSETPAQI